MSRRCTPRWNNGIIMPIIHHSASCIPNIRFAFSSYTCLKASALSSPHYLLISVSLSKILWIYYKITRLWYVIVKTVMLAHKVK